MRLLDLYCGAGGAAKGYYNAGFTEIVGIDIEPQPHYPYTFVQGNVWDILDNVEFLQQFDMIHASPVCKRYSVMSVVTNVQKNYPDEIPELRETLKYIGKPLVIENVPGSPLENYVMLCGTMFGLNVIRHRLFECFPQLIFPPCTCNHQKKAIRPGRKPDRKTQYHCVVGHFSDIEFAKEAMGIDWMTQHELAQAIPPAYTEYIGKQMLSQIFVTEAML